MRILHISSARTLGDAERHVTGVIRELTRRGHEVFVAVRPTNQWLAPDVLPPENILHLSVRNSFGMLSVSQIVRFVEEQNVEIVHAHLPKDYLAASIVRRATRGARLVLTRHVDRPLKPFHRFALRNVDAAIAVSPSIREHLTLTFPAGRIHCVANGIGPDETASFGSDFRAIHDIPAGIPLIATVGELKASGGQRDLVLAAHEIARRLPECYFVVAGIDLSVDKKFRRELKRLVKVLGLDDRFLWLDTAGFDLLTAADLLVSPSHLGELSASTIDAMAAATAVITTATDEIIDARSVVPAMEPLALAERILLFLTDDELRHSIAERGQAAVRDRFSLSRMIDETEKIYLTALGR